MSLSSGFGFLNERILHPGQLRQSIYTQSVDQRHKIGVPYVDYYGDVYNYARIGAVDVLKGLMNQSAAIVADHQNIALGGVIEAGVKEIAVTTVLATAVTENQYVGGKILINDDVGEGQAHIILEHTIGTTPTFTLATPVLVALEATSEFTLSPNRFNGTVVLPLVHTGRPAGVPLIDVTAGNYCWLQTAGDTPLLTGGTPLVGRKAGVGSADGTVGAGPINSNWGIITVASADTEFSLIDLNLATSNR